MPKLPVPNFAALDTLRIELLALAAPLVLDPETLIPSSIRQLPHMPELRKRLGFLAQNGGGIASLAEALPTMAVWQWREMLEKDADWKMSPFDLARICWYLEDPILYYLAGKELGTLFPELNGIPETRHFMHALSWTLRRNVAEVQLLRARIHALMAVHDPEVDKLKREMASLRTQTFILLKQIEMKEISLQGTPVS